MNTRVVPAAAAYKVCRRGKEGLWVERRIT